MTSLRWTLTDHEQLDALDVLERLFLLVTIMRDGFARCGDVVRHAPTGETWTVAYADYSRGDLAWFGWPDGYARIADCAITERCSDAEHTEAVASWLDKPHQSDPGRGADHRVGVIRRLYRPTLAAP